MKFFLIAVMSLLIASCANVESGEAAPPIRAIDYPCLPPITTVAGEKPEEAISAYMESRERRSCISGVFNTAAPLIVDGLKNGLFGPVGCFDDKHQRVWDCMSTTGRMDMLSAGNENDQIAQAVFDHSKITSGEVVQVSLQIPFNPGTTISHEIAATVTLTSRSNTSGVLRIPMFGPRSAEEARQWDVLALKAFTKSMDVVFGPSWDK